ncbi:hypothetical protein [Chryseobacterium indologenes]|uniref:hypothetical protein n=1 Tax=Chryseobacterium indologenes TaxID=253 RepID=UPI001626440B|nr:hypothetical protein [Chryseobacterium indologenes]
MTKEELLKIYSAYLPYNLQIEFKRNIYPTSVEIQTLDLKNLYSALFPGKPKSFQIKPILYDLSYLTKEIERDGEAFMPMLKLAKMESDQFEYLDDDENGFPIIGYDVTDFDMGSMTFANVYRFEYDQESGLFVVNIYDEGGKQEDLIGMDEVCLSNLLLREKLLEWHFNIFQLPEDQFINKATLTNK